MPANFSGSLTIINTNIMKKNIFFLFALFSLFAFSQQTDFNYQAIIKGSNGMAVSNQSIVMQFSIIYDATNGTVAYQENHTVNTSLDGLVNLVIGSGTPTSQTGDSWDSIDWARLLFLKEEVNLGGGFASVGVGRIYAVPVANYAAKAGAIKGVMTGLVSTTQVTATNIISSGSISANGITAGTITATSFSGNGSGLSNISAGAITGVISAPISTTHVTATTFSGDGSGLTNLPSSGANNQIWISHALFERTGSQNIASKTGVFNGYYYEFLNLKKGSSGISQTRATFVPPSHWGNGNYKVTLYFLTENANSGNIQVDWGIQVLTMSGNNVSAGNDFIGNNNGAFQYGTTIGAPPSNLTAAAQTANNKRPLQKYAYTYNYNFSGIDFATLHMSRYLNQGYSYSDTYDGDFYVVGIKIEKNY